MPYAFRPVNLLFKKASNESVFSDFDIFSLCISRPVIHIHTQIHRDKQIDRDRQKERETKKGERDMLTARRIPKSQKIATKKVSITGEYNKNIKFLL